MATGTSTGWYVRLRYSDYSPTSSHSAVELNKMRTFGTGKSEFLITDGETALFQIN